MNFKMYVKIQKKSQTTYDSIPYPSIKTNLKLCHKTQYILIFCIKYSFNIVPFRVIQSKLFQGIVIKGLQNSYEYLEYRSRYTSLYLP